MSWTMSSRWSRVGLAGALALTLVGLLGLTACGGYKGSDKVGPTHHKFLILLCQASDIDTVPHDVPFYERLFLDRKPGQLNVWNFFVDQSYGSSDIEGTVMRGWLKTKKPKDDLLKLRRSGLSEACVKEFQATDDFTKTVTLTDFTKAGVITIWNVQGADGGAAGIKIDGVGYPAINAGRGENPGDNSVSFFTHEMLHSLGIHHARGPAADETLPLQLKADSTKDHTFGKNLAEEYGDCWTIMGCGSSVIWTGDDWGNAGPGLGAAHRYQLGWLPSDRVFLFTGPATTVTLAPSNRPEIAGHLLARIPVNGSGPCCDFYTVEYIERSGWNERIETERAVLIHEIRKSAPGHTYLVSRSVWGTWVPGQVFTDSANRIRISIDSYGDAAKVTISSGGEPDDGSAKCAFTGYKDNTGSKTAPSVKVESPLNNSHVVAGFPVTLRVAAFDPTIDSGTPSAAPAPDERIHWRLGGGVTKDGRSLTHIFPDPVDRKIEVSVENVYCQSTTKVLLLSIDPPPPATVVILEPVNGQEYLIGPPDFAQTITLTGSGSSSITKFEWIDSTSTGVLGTGKTLTVTLPLKTTTHNCAVEPHVITLRGTTSTGKTVTASVTITLRTNCIR